MKLNEDTLEVIGNTILKRKQDEIIMKIVFIKYKETTLRAIGKELKLKCQLKTDNFADISLGFLNLFIYDVM